MRVRDPEGKTWRVTRRWLPWRPRPRSWGPQFLLEAADGITGFLLALVIGLVVLPVATFVLLSGGELVILLVVLPFVVAGRVIFGRTWWVEARLGFRPYWEEESGDWRTSGQRIRQVAEAIERGDPPLRTLGPPAEDPDETEQRPPQSVHPDAT
ncbi:hypothetical protein [Nocardioides humi]|uniref:Uncharacterized protein n=1 Tax=Nocardioides humi TaxID=449461 RepID=A0ABN2BDI6_9ACTN|nr:hypothetical protein [Nocardioides humi]